MTVRDSAVNAINRALKQQGMSRAELARRIGCDRGYISHILNGSGRNETVLKTVTLDRIFDALGYDAKVILRRKPDAPD